MGSGLLPARCFWRNYRTYFCYRNERNQDGVDHVFSKIPWEQVYAQTGIQFIKFNSLYQLGAETPERLKQAATVLPLGDGFNHLLCGVAKAEASMASTTQMYDPRTANWSNPYLKLWVGTPACWRKLSPLAPGWVF